MNPPMLTMARESRGLTQKQLALAAQVSPASLNRAELGGGELPEDKLERIAAVLHYPRSLFDWTATRYGLGATSFYHRKQQSLGQRALQQIQARVNLLAMRLRRLSQSIDVKSPFSIPRYDDGEYDSPADVARAVRASWMLPTGPIDDVVKMMEAAGAWILRRDFGTPRISAISVWPPGEPPLLVLNDGMPADRERFTLCHELGHWVMHSEVALDTKNAEREADQFASELLMPSAEIRHQLHGIDLAKAATLKRYWKTSMAALIRRAHDLDVITDTRYRSLCSWMAQRGFNRSEPVAVAREEPTVTNAMVGIHLHEHGYTHALLAEVVGLYEDEFVSEFDPPASGGLRLVR